ncbi:hypothetical protein DLAC_04984 [Tieghemostelium lacteum]|uniref:Transmembrane protein n=1 Tax=Tieghemostelium lacteum TaxID=361077 RepID=A0A151ZHY3_TIELA|nr:hypothetical protein DLAC_04984 [Tieghemostelium lacteum]|eukprot:KYQ93608.1 hypothetical protein DLAC_04984 [Tieghemostelium lacteum]
MVPIIVFSFITFALYLASFSTAWYWWNEKILVSLGDNNLDFKFTEATYRVASTLELIHFEYKELKETMITTAVFLAMGLLMCIFTLGSSCSLRFLKGKKEKTIIARLITSTIFLGLLFSLLSILYFLSFEKNVRKEEQFCGENTMFQQVLFDANAELEENSLDSTDITKVHFKPGFCSGSLIQTKHNSQYETGAWSDEYEYYSDLKAGVEAASSSSHLPIIGYLNLGTYNMGPGYWLCLVIVIFQLIQCILVCCICLYNIGKKKLDAESREKVKPVELEIKTKDYSPPAAMKSVIPKYLQCDIVSIIILQSYSNFYRFLIVRKILSLVCHYWNEIIHERINRNVDIKKRDDLVRYIKLPNKCGLNVNIHLMTKEMEDLYRYYDKIGTFNNGTIRELSTFSMAPNRSDQVKEVSLITRNLVVPIENFSTVFDIVTSMKCGYNDLKRYYGSDILMNFRNLSALEVDDHHMVPMITRYIKSSICNLKSLRFQFDKFVDVKLDDLFCAIIVNQSIHTVVICGGQTKESLLIDLLNKNKTIKRLEIDLRLSLACVYWSICNDTLEVFASKSYNPFIFWDKPSNLKEIECTSDNGSPDTLIELHPNIQKLIYRFKSLDLSVFNRLLVNENIKHLVIHSKLIPTKIEPPLIHLVILEIHKEMNPELLYSLIDKLPNLRELKGSTHYSMCDLSKHLINNRSLFKITLTYIEWVYDDEDVIEYFKYYSKLLEQNGYIDYYYIEIPDFPQFQWQSKELLKKLERFYIAIQNNIHLKHLSLGAHSNNTLFKPIRELLNDNQ